MASSSSGSGPSVAYMISRLASSISSSSNLFLSTLPICYVVHPYPSNVVCGPHSHVELTEILCHLGHRSRSRMSSVVPPSSRLCCIQRSMTTSSNMRVRLAVSSQQPSTNNMSIYKPPGRPADSTKDRWTIRQLNEALQELKTSDDYMVSWLIELFDTGDPTS